MRITFVLFSDVYKPIGGVKVIYEYANFFSQNHCSVNIIYCVITGKESTIKSTLIKGLKFIYKELLFSSKKNWFQLNNSISTKTVFKLSDKNLPASDAVIATGWGTAYDVAELKGSFKKLYLLQHLETWDGNAKMVENSWKLPLIKIAIAKWLVEYGKKLNQNIFFIPNGLDHKKFYLKQPIDNRDNLSILFLSHKREYKGTKDIVEAIKQLSDKYKNLKINSFGVIDRPQWLPDSVIYYQNPKQDILIDIYNNAAIFITASHEEGWGLPACEAMMCGCAVVASDVGGHQEFLTNKINGLMFEPKNINELSISISNLLDNEQYRIKLATQANSDIKRFSWENSGKNFLELLESE